MGGPEQQGTGSRKSAGCSFGGLQPKMWGGWGGDTAMKGAGVGRLQLCCGVQGTPQEIGGQQQTGSRKSAAGIWGGCGQRKQRWHKVCCRGGGGGQGVCHFRARNWQQKIGGGAPPLRGQGWAAATVLQGTGCRVHHRKLEGSNKLAAEHLLQAFGGGCVW